MIEYIIMGFALIAIIGLFLMRGSQQGPANWLGAIKATLSRLMARGVDLKLMNPWSASAPTSFSYNPACWAAPLDWTGLASAIDGTGTMGGGTLITRRHVLFADHVPYPKRPFDIFFTNKAGKVFTHKIVRIDNVTGTDIAIGLLDRDADSSLKVYRVLPDGWEKSVEGIQIGTAMGSKIVTMKLPILYTTQDRHALTGDLVRLVAGLANVEPPSFEGARPYYTTTRGGDSGNPVFVLIGDEMVLLGSWYRVNGFPWLIEYRKQVETIIGQALQVASP